MLKPLIWARPFLRALDVSTHLVITRTQETGVITPLLGCPNRGPEKLALQFFTASQHHSQESDPSNLAPEAVHLITILFHSEWLQVMEITVNGDGFRLIQTPGRVLNPYKFPHILPEGTHFPFRSESKFYSQQPPGF